MINIPNIQSNKTQRNYHDQLHVILQLHVISPFMYSVKCLPLFVPKGDKELSKISKVYDSTHGSLALKAYQQNLYLKYYY